MDRVTETLLEALKQAAAEAAEVRLYRSGKLEGLFPGRTGAAGEAAAQALRDGLLEVVRTETKGKTTIDWVRLTPRGIDFLHERESPVRALEELRAVLRTNQQAVPLWLAQMQGSLAALDERLWADGQEWLQRLEALERRVEETLRRLEAAAPMLPREVADTHPWAIDALNYLDRRHLVLHNGTANGASRSEGSDCPLPELFAALIRQHPTLSMSAFHEGLRRLHERRALRLLPAEDLTCLAQPEYALFDNGCVLYYAAR